MTNTLSIPTNLPAELVLLTEKEYGTLIGRTYSAVRADRLKGCGCPFVKIGAHVRYRLSDVQSYIESCRRSSTSDNGAHNDL